MEHLLQKLNRSTLRVETEVIDRLSNAYDEEYEHHRRNGICRQTPDVRRRPFDPNPGEAPIQCALQRLVFQRNSARRNNHQVQSGFITKQNNPALLSKQNNLALLSKQKNKSYFLSQLRRDKHREARSMAKGPRKGVPFRAPIRTRPFNDKKDLDCWMLYNRLQRPYSALKNTSHYYMREAAFAERANMEDPPYGRHTAQDLKDMVQFQELLDYEKLVSESTTPPGSPATQRMSFECYSTGSPMDCSAG